MSSPTRPHMEQHDSAQPLAKRRGPSGVRARARKHALAKRRGAPGSPQAERAERGEGPPRENMTAKRLFDVLLSGAGLVLSSPLWLLIGGLITLEDGGPVFFSQERVGLEGRRFQALKFRSMRVDAERFGAHQSGEHDARVTRLG